MDDRPIVCGNTMQASPHNGKYATVMDSSPPERKIARSDNYNRTYGELQTSTTSNKSDGLGASNNLSGGRFETFVMTGDMIIRTSSPQKPKISPSESSKGPITSDSDTSPRKEQDKKSVDNRKAEAGKKSRIPKPTTKSKPKVIKKPQVQHTSKLKEGKTVIEQPVLSLPKSGVLISPDDGAYSVTPNDTQPEEQVIMEAEAVPVLQAASGPPPLTANGAAIASYSQGQQDEMEYPPPPPPDYRDLYTSAAPLPASQFSGVPLYTTVLQIQEDLPPPPEPINYEIINYDNNYATDFNFDDLPPPPEELLQDMEEVIPPVTSAIDNDIGHSAITSDISVNSDFIPLSTPEHSVPGTSVMQIPSSTLTSQMAAVQPTLSASLPNNAAPCEPSHVFDRRSVQSDIPPQSEPVLSPEESKDDTALTGQSTDKSDYRSMVVSKSAEKISRMAGKGNLSLGVRNSKSHENCLEGGLDSVTLVNIDFEDNIASSVDALHYQQSSTSLDRERDQEAEFQSKSLNCSPERKTYMDKHSEKVFMPAFISLEEPGAPSTSKSPAKGKPKDSARTKKFARKSVERSPERENKDLTMGSFPSSSAMAAEPSSEEETRTVAAPEPAGKLVDTGSTNGIRTASTDQSASGITVADITSSPLPISHMAVSCDHQAVAVEKPGVAPAVSDVGAAGACAVDKSPSLESEKGSRDSQESEKSQQHRVERVEYAEEPPAQHIEPRVEIKYMASPSDSSDTDGRFSAEMDYRHIGTVEVVHLNGNGASIVDTSGYTRQSKPSGSQSHTAKQTNTQSGYIQYKSAPPHHPSAELHHAYHDFTNSSSASEDSQTDSTTDTSPTSPSGPSSPESPSGDLDMDSMFHQPLKDVDRPSAQRLAKRLFQLDGFKKGDISKHLSKKNEFAQLVGEEFLKFFQFQGDTLDVALRKFLARVTVAGETQERERVLIHFSRRYMECNPGTFKSDDACHTLTCALMLLNTDLHGQNLGRKMNLLEFIDNLSELNEGDDFPRDTLKVLYQSIREEPLEYEVEDDLEDSESVVPDRRALGQAEQRYIGYNPFLEVPDPSKATEFKKGYVMRKCCIDPDGKRTPLGKRGWKMFYSSLRDLVLYMHKDEHAARKGTVFENMHNAIRIHHALATKATDYTKKQHVFRLQTADWAQYLFQTSNSKELQEWIDTINFVAASLSSPPLPGAVGSQRKFQRPLLPASYTKLNMKEQLEHHEQKVGSLEREISEHRTYPPEKGAKSRVIQDYLEKEQYLQFELKRFKTYVYLLRAKMVNYPEYEPSLVETAIGEVDEPPSSPATAVRGLEGTRPPLDHRQVKPVQRSMSDRYSYRAAIYSQRDYETDLV